VDLFVLHDDDGIGEGIDLARDDWGQARRHANRHGFDLHLHGLGRLRPFGAQRLAQRFEGLRVLGRQDRLAVVGRSRWRRGACTQTTFEGAAVGDILADQEDGRLSTLLARHHFRRHADLAIAEESVELAGHAQGAGA